MLNVAVYAAVAQKAHQVQIAAGLLAIGDSIEESGILKEIAVRNGLGYAGQLLIYDAARAHVHMADFAVTHLAVRQTYVHAGSADLGVGVGGLQRIQMGRARLINRVAFMIGIDAEAIHYDKSSNAFFHSSILLKSIVLK